MSPASMASAACVDEISAAGLFLRAVAMVPAAHYLAASLLVLLSLFYNLFEFHFLRDLLHGFRGDPVVLTFNPASKIYEGVVSKCRIFHRRYLPTPWLASPHLQTAFLHFFGRPPCVTYRRQLFSVRDGGTIALDWLLASDVAGGYSNMDKVISKDDTAPLVIVIPGLTSDSASPYVKHLTYVMAKQGWNVVVSNHRGLAGISITSDCFYNAGWTEDVREVINHLHQEYPKAHIFAVGTSVGANILVKYLGEDEDNTPVTGAASICSPWDLVVCDRFLTRKPVQRLYNRALTMGLKDYAKLHKPVLARLANWEGIRKSGEFDSHATCLVGKFETVDTFYRCCSSVNFTGNIVVPLLCISALDDPLCTKEAIPWDECRANKNIVLATTAHGGHLAYFEGLTAQSLWWVEAVREFLSVLHTSPFIHGQKKAPTHGLHSLLESSIDKVPFVNVMEDGMVAAMTSDGAHDEHKEDLHNPINHDMKPENEVAYGDQSGDRTEVDADLQQSAVSLGQGVEEESSDNAIPDVTASVTGSMNQLSRRYRTSLWLLTYIAIVTTWPLVGSVLHNIFRKKLKGFLPAAWIRR